MKNRRSKRLALIVLSVCMLMTMIAIGFVVHAVALEGDPTLRVKSFALTLENNVCMDFKVSSTNVSNTSDIQLLVWTGVPTEYKKGTEDYALTSKGAESSGVEVFQYENFAAKQMTEMIYVCAYVEQNGAETYSSPAKFSIAMYAYLKRNASNPDAQLVELLNSMLEYGAMSQKYFNYNLDFLATDELCQVTVVNGKLSDGFTKGWYKKGTTTVLTAEDTLDGVPFLYWANSAGAQVSTDLTCTVTISKTAETYTAVYGEADAPVEPLIYLLLDNDTYSVQANQEAELPSAIAIPATYEGKAVTMIADKAFENCASITSIDLPYGIKAIGEKAFSGCSGLSDLSLPETVETIGTRAFYGCTGIAEITIPVSVTDIGTQIFYKASNLHTVYYNASYGSESNPFLNVSHITKVVFGGTYVPSYILKSNTSVKEVEIANSVTYIGSYAFSGCSSLESITIPDSVTSIDGWAFEDCSSLMSVTIGNSVTSIGGGAFAGCNSLTNITIPDSVTNIGGQAFCGCSNLTSITIPDSVTSIDYRAFAVCRSLTSITIPDSVTSIGYMAFEDCSSLTSITIPDSVTSIGDYAFWGCSSLKSITIPDSVTYIGDWAFGYCSSLESITIPDSVTSIGGYAFYGCSSLESITIPDSVTSIGERAFSYCSSLKSITIPDSVTSIGERVFEGCSSLESITIPDSVTSIGNYAFLDCSSLMSVYITDLEAWCNIYFSGSCSNPMCYGAKLYLNNELVTELEIPDSVTSIGDWAFHGCSSLKSITIPDSVTSIGNYVFYYCSSLESITIPDSVTSIGFSAFAGCSSLESINIPDSVTSIGNSALSGCSSLKSITIPDSVTSIGYMAFAGCSSLESITIPDSVTSIGEYAFYYCSSLKSITIPESVTSFGGRAFEYCSSLTTVYYGGTAEDWARISTGYDNEDLTNATRYYYSEAQPTDTPYQYWHYVDGVPTAWEPNRTTLAKYFTFTELDDGTYSIAAKDVNNMPFEVILPSTYNGKPITCVGDWSFFECSSLESITIPDNVTSIGSGAFGYCSSLESITIPDSVTSIGFDAFYDCSSLESITIPDSVTSIGSGAFGYCSSLTSITIPDSVTSIGNLAFRDCSSLTSVTIPDSMTSIGYSAFNGCSSLTNITIPDSVTSIDYGAFYGCSSLTTVYYGGTAEDWAGISIGDENYDLTNATRYYYSETQPTDTTYQYWHYVDGVPMVWEPIQQATSSEYFTFTELEDGTYSIAAKDVNNMPAEVILPSTYNGKSITTIGYGSFLYCSSLASITIPDSVTNIDGYALLGCVSLTIIRFDGSVAQWDAISFGSEWRCNVPATQVVCSNGVVTLDEQSNPYYPT